MQTSKYLIPSKRDRELGLTVSTVGYEEIMPGTPYPTRGHAEGYYFNTAKGRRLDEYQLVYMTEGRGVFRSENMTAEVSLKAGDAILLFPGVWHTYKPSIETGWACYWIGFNGADMQAKHHAGFFDMNSPFLHVGYSAELIRLYDEAMSLARLEAPFHQPLLAGLVNHLLSLVYALANERKADVETNRDTKAVLRAQTIIRQNIEKPLTIQQVSTMLGMSYSRFRRLFKDLTGFPPSFYQNELRMERARQLLACTTLPVKEIAYRLQFESADYFSVTFKRRTGKRPTEYREEPEVIATTPETP